METAKLGMGLILSITPLTVAAGTVAYYRFDGSIGSPVTTITDSGPAGLNGSNTGSTHYSAGVLGTGLDLSGDGNYATIPSSPHLVLTNDFTVELFMKASQPYTVYCLDAILINKLNTAATGNALSSFYISYLSGGSLFAAVGYGQNTGLQTGPTVPIFADGQWHHVALVFHHNSPVGVNRLELFADHILHSATSGLESPVAWADFPVFIGAGNFPGGQDDGPFRRNFDGSIDEVRISDLALTPSDFVTIPTTQFALVAIPDFPGGIKLRWDSKTNHSYQVQFAPELPASTWTNLGVPLTGDGNPLTLSDKFVPGQVQRFFRVVESP